MKWNMKMELGMELIHEACKENFKPRESCEICPFETYCDIIWNELMATPNEFNWVKMGGEDIR